MKTIYKYPLEIKGEQTIKTGGDGANIIHVGLDPMGTPCIWLEVDTLWPYKDLPIYIVGTGNPIPEGRGHVGSFVQGPFVWHVYI